MYMYVYYITTLVTKRSTASSNRSKSVRDVNIGVQYTYLSEVVYIFVGWNNYYCMCLVDMYMYTQSYRLSVYMLLYIAMYMYTQSYRLSV